MSCPDDPQVNFLGDLGRLDVRKGDVFVLTSPAPLSQKHVDQIRTAWEAAFLRLEREAPPVLVLSDGMKIGVVRMEDYVAGRDSNSPPS